MKVVWAKSHIWFADNKEYSLKEISSDGRILRTVSRKVDWFPPGLPFVGAPWVERPKPSISSISTDDAGMLWLLISRAHSNWMSEPGVVQVKPQAVAPMATNPVRRNTNQYFERVIEVLDPASGKLVASTVVGGATRGFAAPRVFYEVVESEEDGSLSINLFAVSLRMTGGTRCPHDDTILLLKRFCAGGKNPFEKYDTLSLAPVTAKILACGVCHETQRHDAVSCTCSVCSLLKRRYSKS